jgi:phospholipase C
LFGAAGLAACADDSAADAEDSETGSGDGDGDPSGDGDGDPSGDGDGDPSGDGDGDGEPYEVCEANDPSLSAEQLLASIDHIVVVMMENRSFDHMFGGLSLAEGLPVDGLTGDETNPTLLGDPVAVFNTDKWVHEEDLPHSWTASHAQFDLGANDGFVREYQNKGAQEYSETMSYYLREQLPVYHALIDEYQLCDRWFASVMGPTWPNRFHLHCATSDGNQGNDPISGVPSIFDQLNEAGVSCRYYASGLPFVVTYGTPLTAPHIAVIQDFFADADNGDLPSFSIVEPTLTAGATIGNDDHPPADVRDGQTFIAAVYDALANSPNWDRCLLVVIYDEHGGFHDHVPPPLTTDPQHPGFEQLGFRIPSLVVGPQVRSSCVNGTVFDHVSIAATIAKRWGLEPLNERVAATADLSSCIDPALIDQPRPPIALPRFDVAQELTVHVPGADYGGQVELAAYVAERDPDGEAAWIERSIETMKFVRARAIERKLVRPV